jgi:hypothetical protein
MPNDERHSLAPEFKAIMEEDDFPQVPRAVRYFILPDSGQLRMEFPNEAMLDAYMGGADTLRGKQGPTGRAAIALKHTPPPPDDRFRSLANRMAQLSRKRRQDPPASKVRAQPKPTGITTTSGATQTDATLPTGAAHTDGTPPNGTAPQGPPASQDPATGGGGGANPAAHGDTGEDMEVTELANLNKRGSAQRSPRPEEDPEEPPSKRLSPVPGDHSSPPPVGSGAAAPDN